MAYHGYVLVWVVILCWPEGIVHKRFEKRHLNRKKWHNYSKLCYIIVVLQ